MKQIKPEIESFARIRVIGTGGSGCNAVNHMINSKVKGVDFIVVNTDAQDLHHSPAKKKIHIGKSLTRGLGSGMNAEVGKHAAEEQLEDIQEALKGSDMVFVTCGLGGGTGTGSAPVIAKAAREGGALTVAIATLPFSFEGNRRREVAEGGLDELRKVVDALIVVPNDKILETVPQNTGLKDAFAVCDDVLKHAVEGISDLITKQGIINVDFADIKAVMEAAGSALMGIGEASGENRAADAALMAINSPLLDVSIEGATGVLFAISGREDLSMHEVQQAADAITKAADPNAKIIFGTIYDDTLKKGSVKVTVIATGFGNQSRPATIAEQPSHEIHNTLEPKKEEKKETPIKEEKEQTPTKSKKPSARNITAPKTQQEAKRTKRVSVQKNTTPDDDDDFSMIPSFLRRSKLR
jgi:cell division protein FtsZ